VSDFIPGRCCRQVRVTVAAQRNAQWGSQTSKYRSTDVGLLATAPVLWHPVPHFFVGVGPAFNYNFFGDSSHSLRPWYSSLGLTSLIGGYFGA
jgi:hypothetical protein